MQDVENDGGWKRKITSVEMDILRKSRWNGIKRDWINNKEIQENNESYRNDNQSHSEKNDWYGLITSREK